jgi:hypothetical protein
VVDQHVVQRQPFAVADVAEPHCLGSVDRLLTGTAGEHQRVDPDVGARQRLVVVHDQLVDSDVDPGWSRTERGVLAYRLLRPVIVKIKCYDRLNPPGRAWQAARGIRQPAPVTVQLINAITLLVVSRVLLLLPLE